MKKDTSKKEGRKKLIWSLVFVGIALLTVWTVASQSKGFSFAEFQSYLKGASAGWMAAAVLCMFGFIFFEGAAVLTICRGFGFSPKKRGGFIYAAADIYFSAITPSATGGQPMSAYFMMKDGIPGLVVTVALVLNLAMYTLAIVVINVLNLPFAADVYASFGPLSHILIGLGTLVQIALVVLYVFCLKNGSLLRRAGNWGIRLLARLHLLRQPEQKRQKLQEKMDQYDEYAQMIKGRPMMVVRAFVFNLLQRACIIAVSVCCFMATGGNGALAAKIWGVQSCVTMGSVCVPIPGAMGVTDYLMLDGFDAWISAQSAANLEMLSRALSFYICVLICGISVFVKFLISKRREK